MVAYANLNIMLIGSFTYSYNETGACILNLTCYSSTATSYKWIKGTRVDLKHQGATLITEYDHNEWRYQCVRMSDQCRSEDIFLYIGFTCYNPFKQYWHTFLCPLVAICVFPFIILAIYRFYHNKRKHVVEQLELHTCMVVEDNISDIVEHVQVHTVSEEEEEEYDEVSLSLSLPLSLLSIKTI